jgi:phytoene dehydrogenase-like protein
MSPDGWAYVQGGMGEVSTALASAALDSGATLVTDAAVDEILIADDAQVSGVRLASGEVIHTSCVLSNVTPHVLMSQLLSSTARETHLPPGLVQRVTSADYTSATTKINVAVDRLPQFSCIANSATNEPGPEHEGTIHLNCESLAQLHAGYVDTKQRGDTSTEPLIEMTIPSAIDQTIAPPGQHVVNLFVQYTPYAPSSGPWTAASRESLARHVFATIDTYAPGFTESVVGAPDVLTPPDLEAVFGLTGGNIMHGEMSLDRLYFNRPAAGAAAHKLPNVSGLYLCGAGCHPGGGVMAAAGRNAATAVLRDFARTDAEQERLA